MGETQIEPMLELNKEEEEEEAQAQVDIWKYILGFAEQAVVKCAIELGIAEAIESHGGSPITLPELSSTLGCEPSYLYRIMRFLINRKIFKAIPTSHNCIGYSQTPLSRRLLKNGEQSMVGLLLLETSPMMLEAWCSLSSRVLTNGYSAFEKAHGKDVWKYTEANLVHSNLINEAMACDAKVVVPVIVKGCSEVFEGVGTVVDVGGGNGTAMSCLVKACPWIHAINYDLPHVIAAAPMIDGVRNEAGDMFRSVPKADVVFMKWVLHDWNDEDSIQILKNCKEAVPKENGKVLIIELVIEEGGKMNAFKDVELMMDMTMMAHTNSGKERTLKEWEYVIKMAGFNAFTVKHIDALQSVIIAFP